MSPSEKHNVAVRQIMEIIAAASEKESDAKVLLESTILGVMLMHRPDPRHAAEYLDVMTPAVLERMRK